MTPQHHIQCQVIDKLDTYEYNLIHKGGVVATRNSDDLFKYAVATQSADRFDLDLFESHSEVLRRIDMNDPHVFILTIISN